MISKKGAKEETKKGDKFGQAMSPTKNLKSKDFIFCLEERRGARGFGAGRPGGSRELRRQPLA